MKIRDLFTERISPFTDERIPRRWTIIAILFLIVVVPCGLALHGNDAYARGYAAGVRHERADADRRVSVARAECHALIENQRAWYEGLHDRAAVVWETNTRALLRDMEHYEEDIERCRHVR